MPTHTDSGKAFAGINGVNDMSIVACIQKSANRNPNNFLYLVVVRQRHIGLHGIDVTPHHDTRGVAPVPALLIVEAPQIICPGQINADFLECLPFGGAARVGIETFNHTAGKCHLPGPGIIGMTRPLDEQDLGRLKPRTHHHCYRGVSVIAEFQRGGAMAPQPVFYRGYINVHTVDTTQNNESSARPALSPIRAAPSLGIRVQYAG